jgi:hypothetical protein
MIAAWGLTTRFERQMFNRNTEQVRQERESTRYWKSRMAYAATSDDYWGFNTDSCPWCAYKSMCQPGYSWPADRELILLQYRQVCARVIMVPCEACNETGINQLAWEALLNQIRLTKSWQFHELASQGPSAFDLEPPECMNCRGLGVVAGPVCVLDLDHAGDCASERAIELQDAQIEIEVTI